MKKNIEIINDGGWHFNNLYDIETISKKIATFPHSEFHSDKYTNLDNIKIEASQAKNTFKKYNWPSIDVTRKSVEETAASIIKIYEIYKKND